MNQRICSVTAIIAAMWIVHLIDVVLVSMNFNVYGLVPRTLSGLPGIVLMPFLHGGWGHLIGNTIPLSILLMILVATRKDYCQVIASIVIFGGLFLWCFGRTAMHVGASALVYGLVGFLIASGFMERKIIPAIISLLVGILYGMTLLAGVLPTVGSNVSWDGHLFGAIAGVSTAYAMSKYPKSLKTMSTK